MTDADEKGKRLIYDDALAGCGKGELRAYEKSRRVYPDIHVSLAQDVL